SPRLIGRHVWPESSVRKTPAEEMATNIRLGSLGSKRTVCRHSPPAPDIQRGPEDKWETCSLAVVCNLSPEGFSPARNRLANQASTGLKDRPMVTNYPPFRHIESL